MVEDTKVAAAYGEGGAEAESMDKAAAGDVTVPSAAPVPDDAGPVGQGTAETDVKANLAAAAARSAAKGAS